MISPADRVHGGLAALDPGALSVLSAVPRVIDFSVNINPYGPPPALVYAAREAPLAAYPDPMARVARRAWARALDIPVERVAVANGAADLFWAIARALLEPGARAVIAEPTFSEFRIAAQAAGAQVETVWAREEDGFRFSLSALRESAKDARALYLCSPNNPTGLYTSTSEITELARALPDTVLVLDQSFLALSDHADDAFAKLPENVLVVRSLTKDFALAGLRIGLLLGARDLISRVEAQRPTWSTSAPAQAAIAEAARQSEFVANSYQKLRLDREKVAGALRAHGLRPVPSSSVYQLVHVGDAAQFREHLLLRGVLVRDCASFGLPGYARIAARPAEDVHMLRAALALL
jgi:histidinol-phosphate/aromatic aminotransferase/cobyric acid decarboxylase-like protein